MCDIKQMKEMMVVARLFITCTCTLLPLGLEGEWVTNNIEKSVQEHFIDSLPSHSVMLSWNCIMPLPVIVSFILIQVFDIN